MLKKTTESTKFGAESLPHLCNEFARIVVVAHEVSNLVLNLAPTRNSNCVVEEAIEGV